MEINSRRIRVADYIFQKLSALGVKHAFLVTGGGAMHLNDAIGRCRGLRWACCHHEQACAMAAESYYRLTNKPAVVNVTTGPGGTNAITGVFGAWTDSIGMIVVSGNVKFETTIKSTPLPLRQLGDQEVDIVNIVKPITKYAIMVTEPESIRYHVEKAFYLATSGRPGPVWLDIPMNVQGTLIDPENLPSFNPESESELVLESESELKAKCKSVLEKLKTAQRPVIMAGGGVRLSGAHSQFIELIEKLNIPVVTNWNAHDVLWNSHQNYIGRPGSVGDRAGNFCVQNSDFLLILGSRLNIRQISYNWSSFARAAYKVMVDIDSAEMNKPTLNIDYKIHANLKDFFKEMLPLDYSPNTHHDKWQNWCHSLREKYPVVLPKYWNLASKVNPYCFVSALFEQLNDNDVIVTGDGTACVVTFQAAQIKPGQRLYTNSGCAAMGYDLPAAIGAFFAESDHGTGFKDKRLICLAGDGSIQMNLQELQTILTYKIPAKIFILNNTGYHSIRQTQQNFFPDNIIGCGEESGLGFPNYEKLSYAYGIQFRKCGNHKDLNSTISETLNSDGVQICEIVLDLDQQFAPKLTSRKSPDGKMVSSALEDMAPFLPREEFEQNMLIPLYQS